MKRIVKGNDFTLRIPVMKVVDGERVRFPLPGCTDVAVNLVNAYRRLSLAFTVDVKEDNVLLARVEGDRIGLGSYALEVKGKLFGNDWRSCEYEQVEIVDNNASGDTAFEPQEGEDSVEMDTAIAVLAPSAELGQLITDAEKLGKTLSALNTDVSASEEERKEAEASRATAEEGRAKAETLRTAAEEARAQAELGRAESEESRAAAESGREQAETERNGNETLRRDAETARAVAEESRAAAESSRAAAETSREKAEDGREEAEDKRTAAEIDRSSEEGIRQESETERVRQETARQTNEHGRAEAETARAEAERQREATLAKTRADCEAATRAANDAASEATLAKTRAEEAATESEKVDAQLDGNVLTVTNRKGEQTSVNLTDADEHVTVNFSTTVEGAGVDGLTINVYINNGADPLQYTSDSNGQAEFTVTKGATYKVVFPYVEGCNILNPVQHVASVGNRIIDAAYVAETEKVERVTIKVSKAEDATSQATAWEGITVHVTVGGVKTDYTTDSGGKVTIEVKNGTSYTVAVDKIDGMYEQSNSYSRTRTAIAESYRQSFIFRNYESGIWLIDDENKQWTYDDWEASGNDASKLMFVRIATLATQRYQGDIIMSIDKMADFAKVAVNKQWCNQNVQFSNIPLNGRDTNNLNWRKFAYNGLLATQTIIAEGDERELSTPAADYCYGITISNGDKTYQGYLPTVYQWEVAWSNFDILVEGVNMKYPELQFNKSMFSGNKWTSTQYGAYGSYSFNTAVNDYIKGNSYVAIPSFACLSTSPSLLSLPDKEEGA